MHAMVACQLTGLSHIALVGNLLIGILINTVIASRTTWSKILTDPQTLYHSFWPADRGARCGEKWKWTYVRHRQNRPFLVNIIHELLLKNL